MNPNQTPQMESLFGNVIFANTRAEALSTGDQFCLSEKFSCTRDYYKYPVYCTAKVWELIRSAVENENTCNDFNEVILDILMMSVIASKRSPDNATLIDFQVIVTGSSIPPNTDSDEPETYRLFIQIGVTDIDQPEPALTLMFPEEH